MELIIKMTAEEAYRAADNGNLANFITAAEAGEKTEKKEDKPFVPADCASGQVVQEDETVKPKEPIKQPETKVPTSSKTYTLDELQKAAIGLMDKGLSSKDLTGLLTKHGATSLPELAEDKFGAFALDLRQLGAEI